MAIRPRDDKRPILDTKSNNNSNTLLVFRVRYPSQSKLPSFFLTFQYIFECGNDFITTLFIFVFLIKTILSTCTIRQERDEVLVSSSSSYLLSR